MVTRTYEVRTYCCQMNVHDSERIAGQRDEAGYAPVADGAQPDVVVFSTCALRENADKSATSRDSYRCGGLRLAAMIRQ